MPGPYFYPRSPCGERRDVIAVITEAQSISIHALLAESDAHTAKNTSIAGHFYPRSPCGERPKFEGINFWQSIISIHALLAESDLNIRSIREGITGDFYPRSPCGERQPLSIILIALLHFYPRSPCGERLTVWGFSDVHPAISIHALLAESDAITDQTQYYVDGFLSTLSLRRATSSSTTAFSVLSYFYPRSPCGERRAIVCVF